MGHEGPRAGAEVNDIVGQQIGFNRGNAVTLNAFNIVKGFQQVKELFACVLAEVTDVHACDDDFLAAIGCHFTGLSGELGDGAAAAAASGGGDGAVAAPVVATVLHLEPVTGAVTAVT